MVAPVIVEPVDMESLDELPVLRVPSRRLPIDDARDMTIINHHICLAEVSMGVVYVVLLTTIKLSPDVASDLALVDLSISFSKTCVKIRHRVKGTCVNKLSCQADRMCMLLPLFGRLSVITSITGPLFTKPT